MTQRWPLATPRALLRAPAYAGAALALLLSMPALADQPAAKAITSDMVSSGQVKIDPAKAYILVNTGVRVDAAFLRQPDGATRAKWQADFDKALAKAKKDYPARLAAWRSEADIAKQTSAPAPKMPTEPTAADIAIDPIELRDQVVIGPMNVYAKDKDSFTYLEEVPPGTYVAYGSPPEPTVDAPGNCLCMGTVSFVARAGVVTDVSLLSATRPMSALMTPPPPPNGYAAKYLAKISAFVAAYHPPAAFAEMPVVSAELHAFGKINNFNGGVVMRLSPIAGVLDYRRDTVIDLRTGQDLPNPTLTSRQKPKI